MLDPHGDQVRQPERRGDSKACRLSEEFKQRQLVKQRESQAERTHRENPGQQDQPAEKDDQALSPADDNSHQRQRRRGQPQVQQLLGVQRLVQHARNLKCRIEITQDETPRRDRPL